MGSNKYFLITYYVIKGGKNMCMNRCGCSNNTGCSNNMATMNTTMYYNGMNNSMLAQNGIGVTNLMYGHAYTPNQTFSAIYSAEQGLANGTMFPELVSYYAPNQSLATMNYLRNASRGGCCNGLR